MTVFDQLRRQQMWRMLQDYAANPVKNPSEMIDMFEEAFGPAIEASVRQDAVMDTLWWLHNQIMDGYSADKGDPRLPGFYNEGVAQWLLELTTSVNQDTVPRR